MYDRNIHCTYIAKYLVFLSNVFLYVNTVSVQGHRKQFLVVRPTTSYKAVVRSTISMRSMLILGGLPLGKF